MIRIIRIVHKNGVEDFYIVFALTTKDFFIQIKQFMQVGDSYHIISDLEDDNYIYNVDKILNIIRGDRNAGTKENTLHKDEANTK
jgi:hypothetical protein